MPLNFQDTKTARDRLPTPPPARDILPAIILVPIALSIALLFLIITTP